jgi:hypothetical protein
MRYDCTQKQTEPGDKLVKVVNYPQEITVSGYQMIELMLEIEGMEKPLQQRFFPNQLQGMFKAMGWAELEPNIFDGDIQDAHGKTFIAELYFEEYEKKDHTKGKARRLRNFRSAVAEQATGEEPESAGPEDIEDPWQE